ncbi:MAG: hypothetical protein ABI601_12715 [bacterium]
MRHKPIKSSARPPRSSDSAASTTRAGIRSLDCGHDDEDSAHMLGKRTGDATQERRADSSGASSQGEQRRDV